MIWYNPLMGTSCAREDTSQRTVTERTVNSTVLCFVIFPPVHGCCTSTERSCCTGPLRTGTRPPVLDPTAVTAATVCLYDNCQTVSVNASFRTSSPSKRNYLLNKGRLSFTVALAIPEQIRPVSSIRFFAWDQNVASD